MDEENTTVHNDSAEAGAIEAQPAEQIIEQSAADQTETEPSEENTAGEQSESESSETETEQPKVDDKLKRFAASNGFELDSPNAIKAAQVALKAQSDRTKEYRANDLEKAVDTEITNEAASSGLTNDDRVEIARIKTRMNIRDFFDSNPGAQDYESAMAEIVTERPYLANDLEALHALAVTRGGGINTVKSQAKKDTLSELAHKQQAAVPTGNATQRGTPKEKAFSDLSIKEMEQRLGYHRI